MGLFAAATGKFESFAIDTIQNKKKNPLSDCLLLKLG
jgi:hypothetical protein